MPNSRIPPLEPPFPADVADELARIMPPGAEPLRLFRIMAHSPRLLQKFRQGSLLDRGAIDRREREIVILRTCARLGAEYEWGVHVIWFARRFGLSERQIAATVLADAADPGWSERDRLLIRLVDALVDHRMVDDALWQSLAETWPTPALLEFLVLTGFYHTVSFVANATRVEPEPGAPGFPAELPG